MTTIRDMTAGDVTVGLGLSRQAGWNQTEADWVRMVDMQPDGCFLAEWEGRPAGTVTTCHFGDVAWVAMVLVDEPLRGRGIGRALVAHALAFLDGLGVRTVRLDATPLGQPLYATMGFVAEYHLSRYHGRPRAAGKPERVPGTQPLQPDRTDALLALDRAVTGTDRARLLRRLAAERPESVRVAGQGGRVDGYLMARPGARATQIGPCVAGPEAGPVLLTEAWQDYAGRTVIVDIPVHHASSHTLARAGGLTVQRTLIRMRRGEKLDEQFGGLWASSGPEKG